MVGKDSHNEERQADYGLLDGAPELADIQVPFEIADGTVAKKTWATLVEEAALPEVSYAHQLHQEHSEANWELMLLPFTKLAIVLNDQQYNPKVAMWQFANAPGKHMFLVSNSQSSKWFMACSIAHPFTSLENVWPGC
jgi:hypothetical protein